MVREIIIKETGKTAGNMKVFRRCFRTEFDNPEIGCGFKKLYYHQESQLTELVDIESVVTNKRVSGVSTYSIVVSFSDACATVYEITDPVTGETFNLSGAGVFSWHEKDYVARAEAALLAETAEGQ